MEIKELIKNFSDEDFFDKINLHIHSNYSDGISDFDSLVEQALKLKMSYISITDHNTINGYLKSKYTNNPILIKGVEFDCFYKMSLLHILGYGIDVKNDKLISLCAQNEKETKNDIIRLFKSRHPKKVIEAIHESGGIAILAHPCCCNVFNLDNYIKHLVNFGLDGIETRYPYNRFRAIVKFSSRNLPYKIAKKYNLITTGGTDEHNSLEKF